jgi:hypothetical protein
MAENPFGSPTSGEKVITEENLGKLFLITPKEVEHEITTVHGTTDALVADVVILDEKGEDHGVYAGTRIFQKVLIGSLKGSIGKKMPVLGVLRKGEKKAGKSAPWVIDPKVTPEQVKIALTYWEALTSSANPFAE